MIEFKDICEFIKRYGLIVIVACCAGGIFGFMTAAKDQVFWRSELVLQLAINDAVVMRDPDVVVRGFQPLETPSTMLARLLTPSFFDGEILSKCGFTSSQELVSALSYSKPNPISADQLSIVLIRHKKPLEYMDVCLSGLVSLIAEDQEHRKRARLKTVLAEAEATLIRVAGAGAHMVVEPRTTKSVKTSRIKELISFSLLGSALGFFIALCVDLLRRFGSLRKYSKR